MSNPRVTDPELSRRAEQTEKSFVLVALAIAAAASVEYTVDPDLWWHLRTGDVIVNDGIPATDPFSWSVPGKSWLTHEWLSEVVLWLTWSAFGHPGLIVLFCAIAVTAFGLAYLVARSEGTGRLPAGALAAAGAFASTSLVGVRPQVFNMVGLATVMLIVTRVQEQRWRPALLWVLVPVMVLWANLHAGYLTGIAVIVVYLLARDVRSTLLKVLPVAFLATLLNPNGIGLWGYPLETLKSDAMRNYIAEWQSPNFHNPNYWSFAILMIIAAVTAAQARPALQLPTSVLLIGSAFAGLQSVRHIPLFCIVAVPVVSGQIAWLIKDRAPDGPPADPAAGDERSRRLPIVGAALAIGVVVFSLAITISRNDDAIDETYPVAAVAWAQESGLASEPVFNHYLWGGYLIWEDIPVFIDGRADLYGDDFLNGFIRTVRLTTDWQEPIDEWQPGWILTPTGEGFAAVLVESDDWDIVYEDDLAVIFSPR